jgi:hypothetical protein
MAAPPAGLAEPRCTFRLAALLRAGRSVGWVGGWGGWLAGWSVGGLVGVGIWRTIVRERHLFHTFGAFGTFFRRFVGGAGT